MQIIWVGTRPQLNKNLAQTLRNGTLLLLLLQFLTAVDNLGVQIDRETIADHIASVCWSSFFQLT